MNNYYDIIEKKKKFDNHEININDLSEEEIKAINKIYIQEINEIKSQIKKKFLNLT